MGPGWGNPPGRPFLWERGKEMATATIQLVSIGAVVAVLGIGIGIFVARARREIKELEAMRKEGEALLAAVKERRKQEAILWESILSDEARKRGIGTGNDWIN